MSRDLTEAQFRKAAAKAGFKPVAAWLEDVTRPDGSWYGMVMIHRSGRGYVINRRLSLSEAIRKRSADRKKAARRA